MAQSATFNGVFEALPAVMKFQGSEKLRKRAKIVVGCRGKKEEEIQEFPVTRRLTLVLAATAFTGNSCIEKSLAEEDNGFWINGPIPVPSVNSKIANEETGTRSFLKKDIYIADIGTKGTQFRIKKTAFDLLALGDLIPLDAWNYFRKYLCLKSTFLYYDFDKIITAAQVEDKQPLTDLANRLFDSFEKLEDAVKKRNVPKIMSCYQDTSVILEEVMSRMA